MTSSDIRRDYLDVTEVSGEAVSTAQISRMAHRYVWASRNCNGKDVLEVACGSGQGLELLARYARSVSAGDYSERLLSICRAEYGETLDLRRFDAQEMPFADGSFDVVILFEALYYLPSAEKFVDECRRVLRPGGLLLLATANKDLFDFNPSPYTFRYYGVPELHDLLKDGFSSVQCYGYADVRQGGIRQMILRPVKALASTFGLIPKTMASKKLLKRVVFGKLVGMPRRISEKHVSYVDPLPLPAATPDRTHQVIYCKATRG